ncbi:MAG: flavodoxin family protein [Bryobacterales bacterium]|nr:flavodoxin family protein [Bryobacterales bacterium]
MFYRSVTILAIAIALSLTMAAEELRILVAYQSESGQTKILADAIAAGARTVESASVQVKSVADVTSEDLAAADGVALGSPVHMGDAAWQARRAIDRWAMEFGFWDSRALMNKPAAVFATGAFPSNGKELTMISLGAGLAQLGMVLVTPYGSFGASATTVKPDPGVDDAERKIASDLGRRLAEIALQLKRGKQ